MTKPVVDSYSEPASVTVIEQRARLLGDRLRQAFDEVVAEPLPETFADLLRQLD